jgi:hypothetical protein
MSFLKNFQRAQCESNMNHVKDQAGLLPSYGNRPVAAVVRPKCWSSLEGTLNSTQP